MSKKLKSFLFAAAVCFMLPGLAGNLLKNSDFSDLTGAKLPRNCTFRGKTLPEVTDKGCLTLGGTADEVHARLKTGAATGETLQAAAYLDTLLQHRHLKAVLRQDDATREATEATADDANSHNGGKDSDYSRHSQINGCFIWYFRKNSLILQTDF